LNWNRQFEERCRALNCIASDRLLVDQLLVDQLGGTRPIRKA